MSKHVRSTEIVARCARIAAATILPLSGFALLGCDTRPPVENDLRTVAATFARMDDDSQVQVSPSTARFVVYADWQIRNFYDEPSGRSGPTPSSIAGLTASRGSASPASQPAVTRLIDTEAYKRLVAKARTTLGEKFVVPQDDIASFQRFSASQRQNVASQAERALWKMAAALEAAGADGALERVLKTEVELKSFGEDLKSASKRNAGKVPIEPFALIPLPPPETLERVIEGLEGYQHRLTELLAVSGDPQTELSARFVSDQLGRIRTIKDSAERKAFAAERAIVFNDIQSADWSALATTRKSRVDVLLARARELVEVNTGYLELRMAANGIRGPPNSAAEMVLNSLRSYDIDPSEWTRNEARLRAMASELSTLPDGAALLNDARATELDVVAAMLDEQSLQVLREANSQLAQSALVEVPADQLFADKRLHHTHWRQALDREAERRKQGRNAIRESEAARKLLATYADSQRPLPTTLAETYFLQLVDYRFPAQDLMPAGLRETIGMVLKSAVHESTDRAAKLFIEYRDISDKLAQSTAEVPEPLLSSYRRSRSSLEGMAFHLDKAFAQAQAFNADVSDIRAKKEMILALLPRLQGWRPPEPPPSGTSKPDGPLGGSALSDRFPRVSPPGADPKLRRYQPGFEKDLRIVAAFLDSASQHLDQASKLANGVDIGPVKFAAARGRFTVSESDLWKERMGLRSEPFVGDTSKPRLDQEWNGRLDKDGKPFRFAEVKEPKQMRVLGGGIHLGETAITMDGSRLKNAALVYEPQLGLVIREGSSDRRWIVVGKNEANTTSLKALYRFANSGRNAAFSLGWGTDRESRPGAAAGTRRVLPDPYLVDTVVGQDLLLADLLPWRLENPTLPNGRTVTFHAQFKDLVAAYRRDAKTQLQEVVAQTNPYKADDRMLWLERFNAEHANLTLRALWQSDSMEESLRWYVAHLDKKELDLAKAEHGDTIRRNFEASIFVADPEVKVNYLSLSPERKKAILNDYVDSTIRDAFVKAANERWSKLPPNIETARHSALEAAIFTTMRQSTMANRAVVECYVAVQKSRGISETQITDILIAASDPTTLALLHDDHVEFILREDGKVQFDTKLKYLYVTSFVRRSGGHIGMSTSPASQDIDVRPLPELTALVNQHIGELLRIYPPLQRTKRHAEIAALFRWAIAAHKAEQLALIDLGELGAFPANDRSRTPTPDIVNR